MHLAPVAPSRPQQTRHGFDYDLVATDAVPDLFWSQATDVGLHQAAAAGCDAAFAEIVRRHAPAMHRYCRRVLGGRGDGANRDDVDDIVQEALIAAWTGLPAFRGDSGLRTWLFAVTRHKAVDLMRRNRPIPVDPFVIADEAFEHRLDLAGDPAGSGGCLGEALKTQVRQLSHLQRAVWLLREVDQLSYREIAQVLHVSEPVVRGQLNRARPAVRHSLQAWR